jgi:hypothetical protein
VGTFIGLAALLVVFGILLLLARLVMYLTSPARSSKDGGVSMVGGLWLDSLKLSWPFAKYELSRHELVVSSVPRRGRLHVEPVVIERAAVVGIRCYRTPLGSGFRVQGVGVGLLYLWPGRSRSWLEQWRSLGWPTADERHPKRGTPSAPVKGGVDHGKSGDGLAEPARVGARWILAAVRACPIILVAFVIGLLALGGADPVVGAIGGLAFVVCAYALWWRIVFRVEIDGCHMVGRSGFRVARIDMRELVEIVVPRAAVFPSLALGSMAASEVVYRVCFVGRGSRYDWDQLVTAVKACSPSTVVVGPST